MAGGHLPAQGVEDMAPALVGETWDTADGQIGRGEADPSLLAVM